MTFHEHLAVFDQAWAAQDAATAEPHIKQALLIAPCEPDALWRYAQVLAHKDKYDEAREFAERCVGACPTEAKGWATLTGIYSATGEVDKVIEAGERAAQLSGVFPLSHWNMSHALLKKGQWKRGWELYEWGKVVGQRRVRCVGKEWDGTPIPGKRLFVWQEQGFGDTVMFMRFLRLAKERSQATVHCDVQRQLYALLGEQTGADRCFASTDHHSFIEGFDYHVSMASLPHVLGLETEDELRSEPYIKPVRWAHVPNIDIGKVGLVWRGSPSHPNDRNRSIPDEYVKRLQGKADWLSLQHGAQAMPFKMAHVGHMLSDFGFTAAVVAQLKLLVTADTCVGHIAGAMGVPTIMVAPLNGEWRWGLEGPRTPWYDSMTVVRAKDWGSAIGQVVELLPEWVSVPPRIQAPILNGHTNGHTDKKASAKKAKVKA